MQVNLYLIRHGESEYNVDKDVRLSKMDWDVKLTKKGVEQSIRVGKLLTNIDILPPSIYTYAYVSPFKRTQQTYSNIKNQLNNSFISKIDEPLISEQRTPLYYGNMLKKTYDDFLKTNKQNVFWAKYLDYETGFEVYQRAEIFKNKLERHIYSLIENATSSRTEINILMITHGFFMRTMLMCVLNLNINKFHKLKNPEHCEIIKLSNNADITDSSQIFHNFYTDWIQENIKI